jgi:uncharacterized repeat protein (TIGR03803 family)
MTTRAQIRKLGGLFLASSFAVATASAQTFQVVHSLTPDEGSDPQAGIVQLDNGDFGGTTVGAIGTLFQMDASGRLDTLYRFKGYDGANPHAPVWIGADGDWYGTTMNGASGWGDVYRFECDGSLTVLKSFVPSPKGTMGEGGVPHAPLISVRDRISTYGSLYGVTTRGGKDDLGTIFRMDESTGDVVTLHSFNGWNGSSPYESLLEFEGRLYGTTTAGGLGGGGVIFRIDPDGTAFTVMHNFTVSEGIQPEAPLIAVNGMLYGTTFLGGKFGLGTVFRIEPSTAHVTVLHHFNSMDGANPHAALVMARDGFLYGTTYNSGIDARATFGTVFRMDRTGTRFETIHRFGGMDGAFAQSRLIEATDGALYGTTAQGGSHNQGVVFRIVFVPVSSIQPSSGPAAGGRQVTVAGSNFQPGVRLGLGGESADLLESSENALVAVPPALEPGTLNDVLVDNADRTRGGILRGYFADFLDVPQDDVFHVFVEKAVRHRITAGRGDGTFGRDLPATHAQAAVFLLRSKHGPFFTPPPATGQIFLDVSKTNPFAGWIEELYNEGITNGWKGGKFFFPGAPTSRADMAQLLLKSEHGSQYVPPPCRGTFIDVPCSSEWAPWIDQLYQEHVTEGCRNDGGILFFCPNAPTTRGQTSVFLVRTFALN